MPKNLPPLTVIVLSLLSEGPAHAYDLLKVMKHRQAKWQVNVNVGAVYRAVQRLEQEGFITQVGTDRDGNRPERTVYCIADSGMEALQENVRALMSTEKRPTDLFRLGLTFLDDLDSTTALELLNQRRILLRSRLDESEMAVALLLERGLPRRFLLVYELDNTQMHAEIQWLDEVITSIESGTLNWDHPAPTKAIDITDLKVRDTQ